MAYAMYLAGMDVKDVHMTDLISGRETLRRNTDVLFSWEDFLIQMYLVQQKDGQGHSCITRRLKAHLDNFYKR